MNQPLQETREQTVSDMPSNPLFISPGAGHYFDDDSRQTGSVSHPDIVANATFETSAYRPAKIEPPDFGQFRMLLGSLLLTTLLAVASAWDAKNQCIDQEIYSWKHYHDDDTFDYSEFATQEGSLECLNMFQFVILPVGGATFLFGCIALWIIHRHLRYLETMSDALTPSHLSVLLRLLVICSIVGLAWTYGNFAIMLKPKKDANGYKQNPYRCLAAVDQMGHIGDNANLYYLSWMSHTLIVVLVYLVCVDCFRWGRQGFEPQPLSPSNTFIDAISVHDKIHAMLSYSSAREMVSMYRKRRKTWYQFMLRLRQRSGFWVAAFCASVLVLASSSFLYVQVLVNLASSMSEDDSFRYREVCNIIKGNNELPEEFCMRTNFSMIAGAIATCLCLFAMILHVLVRRKAAADEDQGNCTIMATQVLPGAMHPETSRLQLGMEFLLSLCLSIILGLTAIFATGAQGPASSVGNLYYASWISFLLCLRICLGCLEEIYYETNTERGNSESEKPDHKDGDTPSSSLSGSQITLDMDLYERMAKMERPNRLRKYFVLSIFSTICAASAYDAAYNQGSACTKEQNYLIMAPTIVAGLSVVMFFLCLKPKTYWIVSHIGLGGIVSIICFVLWLADLIITMHSDDSWAVNSIGEMKLANLYYFSWASIITAGLQMISYAKPFFGAKAKDVMILVWAAIVKVCMVILGASLHVWHTIAETCAIDDKDTGDATFCSRTKFAMVVAIVGVFSGWFVIGMRMLNCISSRTRSRAEATISIALVLLFGVAVALITSIGGPGQSVGDLYYSTWLSFWVCIGIFVSCYDQMRQEEMETEVDRYRAETETAYIDFDDNENEIEKT